MWNLVEKLTEGIWTSQKQNLFLASHDDILIVEGPTDETFISAALKCFQKQGKYVDLAFEYIPCGGASNVKAFAQKFTPKEGQTVIAFFDGDKAGESSMNNVIPCTLSGKKLNGTLEILVRPARMATHGSRSIHPMLAEEIKNTSM